MESFSIDRTWSVNDVLRHYPAAVSVFHALGLDTCCSGALSLTEAAQKKQLDITMLLDALQQTGVGVRD